MDQRKELLKAWLRGLSLRKREEQEIERRNKKKALDKGMQKLLKI